MKTMKILKFKFFIIAFAFAIFANQTVSAQGASCAQGMDMYRMKVKDPWQYNDLSKVATCATGNQYEFILTLNSGKDYRLQFYAAAIFNDKMTFKIIDMSTNKTVLDLPGTVYEPGPGKQVLSDYFDEDQGKTLHPYFDFFVKSTTKLKVLIEIPEAPKPTGESAGFNAPAEIKKGCVTVLVLDRPAE